jgi:hypothetical protein
MIPGAQPSTSSRPVRPTRPLRPRIVSNRVGGYAASSGGKGVRGRTAMKVSP